MAPLCLWRTTSRLTITALVCLCAGALVPSGMLPAARPGALAAPLATRPAMGPSSRFSAPAQARAPMPPRQIRGLLAASACPMAHCDPQMSDDEALVIPTSTIATAWTFTTTGMIGGTGLGCTVGPALAVCAGTNPTGALSYDQPYVYALDPTTGRQIWNSGTRLNGLAMRGAPLIDSAGNSYVSDGASIISFSLSGAVRWQVPNPAHNPLISLNMLADGHLVGQAFGGPLVVLDPATGQLWLRATLNGEDGTFVTLNTVAVLGTRVYVATHFCPDSGCAEAPPILAPGRLYALDVVQGVPHVVWTWSFEGATGGSPLAIYNNGAPLIYFDGSGRSASDPPHAWLFAVADQNAHPALRWAVDLTATYGGAYGTSSYNGIAVSPAHDPRGGVWVWVSKDQRLFRFDQYSGALLQLLNLGSLLPRGWYVPTSALSIVLNGRYPVMLVGVADRWQSAPAAIVALDLDRGRVLWQISAQTSAAAFKAQFPFAVTGAGVMLVVPRADAPLIEGYRLQ